MKKLPSQLYSGIKFILNFEISKKTAIISGIIILGFYIGFSSSELFLDERNQWPDYFILRRCIGYMAIHRSLECLHQRTKHTICQNDLT